MLERGNHDLRAERRLRERNRNMAVQIVLAPLEEFVVLNVQHNVKITRRTALSAGIALSGYSQLRSIVDAGGNFQLERFFSNDAAVTAYSASPKR